jgi:hypothetical protein
MKYRTTAIIKEIIEALVNPVLQGEKNGLLAHFLFAGSFFVFFACNESNI